MKTNNSSKANRAAGKEPTGKCSSGTKEESLRILEALLFAATEPLNTATLAEHLPEDSDLDELLQSLQESYHDKGVNLVRVSGRWAFRTAEDLSYLLEKYRVQQRKLSKAALETLAIIAYHQPVTRAEIEDIRGVSTSKGTIDVLMETGWIRPRGRRRVPGRPLTYGTNDAFLDHFGFDSIKDLPGIKELRDAGLLEGAIPSDFAIPKPDDSEELQDTEDPLEDPQDELFEFDPEDSNEKSVVHSFEDPTADEEASEAPNVENDGIAEPLKKFGT
ncbi:MAG: SMC-Scp complex subunit ScpB [Methyloligellaceae bacterium]